jgi:hypothetical protein
MSLEKYRPLQLSKNTYITPIREMTPILTIAPTNLHMIKSSKNIVLECLSKIEFYFFLENYDLEIIEILTIKNCEITNLPKLHNLVELNIEYCHQLTEIPSLFSLLYLKIECCNNLLIIRTQPNIYSLTCRTCPKLEIIEQQFILVYLILYMCNSITNINSFSNLVNLSCNNCSDLIGISNLPILNKLDCKWCINLVSITDCLELVNLTCENCHNLEKIPFIESLQFLECSSCLKIVEIPQLPALIRLNCNYCPIITLPNLPNLISLHVHGCKNLRILPIFEKLEQITYDATLEKYTIPLRCLSIINLNIELITQAIDYNIDNIDFLPTIIKKSGNIKIVEFCREMIANYKLVKSATKL